MPYSQVPATYTYPEPTPSSLHPLPLYCSKIKLTANSYVSLVYYNIKEFAFKMWCKKVCFLAERLCICRRQVQEGTCPDTSVLICSFTITWLLALLIKQKQRGPIRSTIAIRFPEGNLNVKRKNSEHEDKIRENMGHGYKRHNENSPRLSYFGLTSKIH